MNKNDKNNKNYKPNTFSKYKYGFRTKVESDKIKPGISKEIVKIISNKKEEPGYILEWRLNSFSLWEKMDLKPFDYENFPKIDFQKIVYYSSPRNIYKNMSKHKLSNELKNTYSALGVKLEKKEMDLKENKKISTENINKLSAVDAVFDSVSIITTYKKQLEEIGIIFCSLSEAIKKHPKLIKKYLGSVVPPNDNFFSALNSAVFSDGSFVYVPKNTRCPINLSTYFRINDENVGQFERTLIIAEKGSYVSYMEGCTASIRKKNQLHAAVVEIIALENATVEYSTVQNWYPGDENGEGGVLNFVTKRGLCYGKKSRISWTQVETGSSVTFKYPGTILLGDNSSSEFYSVSMSNNFQIVDTGTKMIHIGKNTSSTVVSKAISSGKSINTYRGLIKIEKSSKNARNYTQCDSLLIGNNTISKSIPKIKVNEKTAIVEHEAYVSKINEEQIFYLNQRGISEEDAISIIVSGFCNDIFLKLPAEFSSEIQKMIENNLKNKIR